MTRIRLDFCDFWPGFCKTKNFFYDLLSTRFDIELADKPDFIIYADFGHHHKLYTCPRIFFSGEGTAPNFNRCDYAFTSHYVEDPRHMRLPLYVLYLEAQSLVKPPDYAEQILANQRKFCSFIVSNPKNKERIDFFQRLNARRQVDSGGRHLNNIGGPVADKNKFIASYRFNISFENRAQAGYTTEKIVQAMQAGCIPIYWGNSLIGREFNTKSFLHHRDFPSEEALIERILEMDEKPELYRQYLKEPWFCDNHPSEFFDKNRLLDQFERIFSTPISPIGRRRSLFQIGRWIMVQKQSSRTP